MGTGNRMVVIRGESEWREGRLVKGVEYMLMDTLGGKPAIGHTAIEL